MQNMVVFVIEYGVYKLARYGCERFGKRSLDVL